MRLTPVGDARAITPSDDGGMDTLNRIIAPALSWQTARDALYLLLGLAYGIVWGSLAITLYAVGLGTVVIWIGVGILVLTQMLMRSIGAHERFLARSLLGASIPDPEAREEPRVAQGGAIDRFLGWSGTVWRDRHAWRVLAWVGFRFVLAPLGFTLAVVYFVVPLSLFVSPLVPHIWNPDDVTYDGWAVSFYAGPPLGAVGFILLSWAVKRLADAHRSLGRWALGPVNS